MRVLRHIVMRFLMWNMRWMTRHIGFLARPFIAWYAKQKIIACGLRDSKTGENTIIYTPASHRGLHTVYKKIEYSREKLNTQNRGVFSRNLMVSISGFEAEIGDTLVVRANKLNEKGGKSWRVYSSPSITIKCETITHHNLIHLDTLRRGSALFSWKEAKKYDPMIYFLLLEDYKRVSLSGIYTTETHWLYPNTKSASLSVGKESPLPLGDGKSYIAKLLVVDYDGWVSHIGILKFTY